MFSILLVSILCVQIAHILCPVLRCCEFKKRAAVASLPSSQKVYEATIFMLWNVCCTLEIQRLFNIRNKHLVYLVDSTK